MDWVPGALPEGRVGAGPVRRQAALRARRPAPRRAAGLGHPTSSTSGAARCATSSSPTRCTGSRSSTSTACGSTPSPRCSTSTTPARTASGCRTSTAGARTSRRSRFLQEVNATAYKRNPGIVMIAEESTAWPGVTAPTTPAASASASSGTWAGCTTRCSTSREDPMHRAYHHDEMTFSFVYAFSENFVLPISHDEVVHGKGSLLRKMPGDHWQKLANVRAYLAFMWAHPGQAAAVHGLGVRRRQRSGPRARPGLVAARPARAPRRAARWSRELNRVYRDTPALWSQDDNDPAGFEWIDADDAGQQRRSSFLRWGADGSALACIANFAGDAARGLPASACPRRRLDEVLNTDADDVRRVRASATSARSERRRRALARPSRRRRPCASPRSAPSGCARLLPPIQRNCADGRMPPVSEPGIDDRGHDVEKTS